MSDIPTTMAGQIIQQLTPEIKYGQFVKELSFKGLGIMHLAQQRRLMAATALACDLMDSIHSIQAGGGIHVIFDATDDAVHEKVKEILGGPVETTSEKYAEMALMFELKRLAQVTRNIVAKALEKQPLPAVGEILKKDKENEQNR